MQEEITYTLFENYEDAAIKLLDILPTQRMQAEKWLIVAISAQSVVMAKIISEKLKLNFDLLFTEPILMPNNPEYNIAMVSETQDILIHEELANSFNINIEFIYGQAHRTYEEKILKLVYKYRQGELISSLKDAKVMILDVGCETGLKALCAIKTAICSHANSVMFVTPMLPYGVEDEIEKATDELYTIHHITNFIDTKFYYKNFDEITQKDVLNIIQQSQYYLPLQKLTKQQIKTGEINE